LIVWLFGILVFAVPISVQIPSDAQDVHFMIGDTALSVQLVPGITFVVLDPALPHRRDSENKRAALEALEADELETQNGTNGADANGKNAQYGSVDGPINSSADRQYKSAQPERTEEQVNMDRNFTTSASTIVFKAFTKLQHVLDMTKWIKDIPVGRMVLAAGVSAKKSDDDKSENDAEREMKRNGFAYLSALGGSGENFSLGQVT
jgi:hypothetical protein